VLPRPAAVMDDRLDTTWVAAETDRRPKLELEFPYPVFAGEAQFLVDEFVAAARAKEVRLSFDGGPSLSRTVRPDGRVRWPSRSFSHLAVTFGETWGATNVDGSSGYESPLPVGVSELRLTGVTLPRPALEPTSRTGVPCGFGPELRLGEERVRTRVTGSVEDLMRGTPLKWLACEPLPPIQGEVVIHATPSSEFSPSYLRMGPQPAPIPVDEVAVTQGRVVHFSDVAPSEEARVVSLAQNYSSGWLARDTEGRSLETLRVDGWKQGWVVPEGTQIATAQFTPNTTYRALLMVGMLALTILAGITVAASGMRRSRDSPTAATGHRNAIGLAPLLVTLGLLGGWVGAAGAVLGVATVLLGRHAARSSAPVVLLGLAGLWTAVGRWPGGSAGFDNWAVAVLAYAAVAAAVVRR
jgi:arabinofuranan 3-O-arabinosyltransferase